MNRIGCAFLAVFAICIALIATLVDFGGRSETSGPAVRPPEEAGGRQNTALVLPVRGVRWEDIRSTWGEPREGGERAHSGTDIMAPGGTPVVAAADGVVEKLFFSDGGGGITAYIRSPNRRLSYYYAHLQGYAANLREGARVRAGDAIGYVGDTGNAGAGNTHLHFGIERIAPDTPWYRGQAVDPYPLLARGRSGG